MASIGSHDGTWASCIAVVTGSTQGIGKEIARQLAAAGYTVVINGRKKDTTESCATELQASCNKNNKVLAVAGDLGTAEGTEKFISDVDALAAEYNLNVGVLVNNMGVFEVANFFEVPDSRWQQYFDVNFMSCVRLSRHWLQVMLKHNKGRILMISSEVGERILPDMLHYSITKQMQIGLARGLAQLTKGSCVTVNSILPGPTWTEGVQTFVEGLAKQENTTITDATTNYFKQREPTSLLQRFILPSEVAATAVFLASQGAAATNGAAIRCEGGLISHV